MKAWPLASLLLPLLLALWANPGCKRSAPPASPSHPKLLAAFEPFPDSQGAPGFDAWYLVTIRGQRAGSQHVIVRAFETPGGRREFTTMSERQVYRRAGVRLQIAIETAILENERGELLRLHKVERQEGGEEEVLDAGRLGSELLTLRGPEVKRVPLEPAALGPQRPFSHLWMGKAPPVGATVSFRAYSSILGGYSDDRVTVTAVEEGPPRRYQISHESSEWPGVVNTLQLDSQFEVLAVEAHVGKIDFKAQRTTGPVPEDGGADGVDLDTLASIPSAGAIDDPDGLVLARYRIENLPARVDDEFLTGPGQKVLAHPGAGTFEIEVKSLPEPAAVPFPMQVPAALGSDLLSTALAQADDPEIARLARDLTAGAPDAWTAMKRLRRWVHQEIASDLGTLFGSATEVLRKRRGDCSEKAVLLAALARSAGIPARTIMGLVYSNGRFGRHMWNEAWLGEWHPLDAAFGPEKVSAARIRLGVFPLELDGRNRGSLAEMLAFASDLRITVLPASSGSAFP